MATFGKPVILGILIASAASAQSSSAGFIERMAEIRRAGDARRAQREAEIERSEWGKMGDVQTVLARLSVHYGRVKPVLDDLYGTTPEEWDRAIPIELQAQKDRCSEARGEAGKIQEGLASRRVAELLLASPSYRTTRIKLAKWADDTRRLLDGCEFAFHLRLDGKTAVRHVPEEAEPVTEFSF